MGTLFDRFSAGFMSKTQKKFVQQDFPTLPLLSEKEIRHGFKYTDIGAVEVTASILGKAKIRKIPQQDQMKLRWLALIISLLVIAGAVWFTAHIVQKVGSVSAPTLETVVVPLSQSTDKPAPDDATKIDPGTTNPEKIKQSKAQKIEPEIATKAGGVQISQTSTDEVKEPSVLKQSVAQPSNIEVHAPGAEALQNEENVAPVEDLVDESAPTVITHTDADSKDPASE